MSYDPRPAAPYAHIIRGADDPDRIDRARSLGGTTRGDAKVASLAQLRKRGVAELGAEILQLLDDGRVRTFNRIAVELWDKTADLVFHEAPDHALWALVSSGDIEHTISAPILFRRKRRDGAES